MKEFVRLNRNFVLFGCRASTW